MAEIGTPLSSSATKVLFCGAGELGKEVIIEMMRLGVEVIRSHCRRPLCQCSWHAGGSP